jgi:hypothetical protein
MAVIMRIIQQFDVRHEAEFMALERQFAQLERARADYPQGRRLQPISSSEPVHTLIWEGEFPDLEAARRALDFFAGDAEHEELLAQQKPFFQQVRVEFFKHLEF